MQTKICMLPHIQWGVHNFLLLNEKQMRCYHAHLFFCQKYKMLKMEKKLHISQIRYRIIFSIFLGTHDLHCENIIACGYFSKKHVLNSHKPWSRYCSVKICIIESN